MIRTVHLKLGHRKEYAHGDRVGTHITLLSCGAVAWAIVPGRRHRRRVDGFIAQVCREHRTAADAIRVLEAVCRSHDVRLNMGGDALRTAITTRAES